MSIRVVALPGTLCPPEIFDRLATALGDDVRVDAVPWLTEPGPWDIASVAARVVRRIEQGGEPVLLVGHSTGGAVALRVALDRPDLVSALLLLNTGAHMQGHGDVQAILRQVREDWGEELRAAVLDRSFAEPPDAATRTLWLAWSATVEADAVHQVLASQAALDLRPELPGLAVRTSVVHGELDRARTVEHARGLVAAIPDARLTLLDTGHSPMHEAPAAVAAALRALARG